MANQRHKKIVEVFTHIHNRKQLVAFVLENFDKVVFLTSDQVFQNTGVKITEVEILVGSKLRPVLYRKGDRLIDGRLYDGDKPLIKNFWIEKLNSYENMKRRNSDLLKDFKEINKTSCFSKRNKNFVVFSTDERSVFVSENLVCKITGIISDKLGALNGSFIAPEYYVEGEKLYSGKLCHSDNKIVKKLNLRFSSKFDNMLNEYLTNKKREEIQRQKDRFLNEYEYDWLGDASGSNDPEIRNAAYWNID